MKKQNHGLMNKVERQIKDINDRHFRSIQKILNKNSYLFTDFVEATPQQDQEEGFDAIFSFPDVKIPIRIRKNYAMQWRDITIRSKSQFGHQTEIDKILDGKGDYYFYGWEAKDNRKLACYTIFDISKFIDTGIAISPDIKDKPNKGKNDNTCFNIYNMKRLIKQDVILIYEYLLSS